MKKAIFELVKRMSGGRDDLAAICARTVADGAGPRDDGGGDVCCRVTPEEAEALSGAPNLVARVVHETDPDSVDAPFALCGNLLYTRRNWRYEQIVRRRIGAMALQSWMPDVVVPSEGEFASLRPEDQRPAVPKLLATRFSILTGGPGTGKTFTLGKAVKLMRARNPDALVALAAPTGKAAARINESLDKMKRLGVLDGVQPATTLHELLEPRRDFVSFKHDRSNPLALDWVVVDESSMIALPLMAKLLEAMPETCALTLIGDAHQLASVEQGRVFGDLCEMFGENAARLTISKRFTPGGTIDRLAHAVNSGADGSVEEVKAILAEGHEARYMDIGGRGPSPNRWGDFRARVIEGFGEFASCTDASRALERLNAFRILCALRGGPYGVEGLNGFVEKIMGRTCPRPVMVTQNDRTMDLHNGDVGVVMPDDPQYLCLRSPGNAVRKLRLEILPATEPAFATTIHKSQGSEFDDVAIVLPPGGDNPLLTREILYTGITRTKRSVLICADVASVAACCERAAERVTGLR